MVLLIIGLDPGGTTGVAVFNEKRMEFVKLAEIRVDELRELFRLMEEYRPNLVIVEEFALYPWKAKSLSFDRMIPAQVIGAVKAWCHDKGITVTEQPAAARKMVSNDVVKKMGVLKMGRGKHHARDAARHVLWYCLKHWPDRMGVVLQERGDMI